MREFAPGEWGEQCTTVGKLKMIGEFAEGVGENME